jgi:hypothetical protein
VRPLACLIALAASVQAAPLTVADLRAYAIGETTASDDEPLAARVSWIMTELRAGKAHCARTDDGSVAFGEYAPPTKGASLASPCARRWRLRLELDRLPVDFELGVSTSDLRAITRFDDDLVGTIALRISLRARIELAHLLDLRRRAAPFLLDGDPQLMAFAVHAYHLEGAADHVSAQTDPDVVEEIALDPRYPALTRQFAIIRLAEESTVYPLRLRRLFARLVTDPHPEVAAAAAELVGTSLARPQTTDRWVLLRALAVFASSSRREAELAATYAPRGLDIVDADGRTRHVATGRTIRVDYVEAYDYRDELAVELKRRAVTETPTLDLDAEGHLIVTGFQPPPP